MNTEPITIEPEDLSDDVLLDVLAALRREIPSMVQSDDDDLRSHGILKAGMALASEAWRRGLINTGAKQGDGER